MSERNPDPIAVNTALAESAWSPVPGRYLILFLLTLVTTCAVMDRAVITICVEAIRREFHLSDGQFGLASGLAFSVTFGLATLPFGLLADRVNRRNLIAGSIAFWSAMTAICGSAPNFLVLLIGRMGIGAGEAGGMPAIVSTIADLFPPSQRARAVAFYFVSNPLGAMAALGAGGVILQAYGWRAVWLAASIPGLLCALALWGLTKEPSRAASTEAQKPASLRGAVGSLGEAFAYIAGRPALAHLLVAMTLMALCAQATASWAAAFFMRFHHAKPAQIGPILAFAMCFGILGALYSGTVADWLSRRDPRRGAWFLAATSFAIVPVLLAALFAPSDKVSIAIYVIEVFITFQFSPPSIAMSLSLTEPRIRATVYSVSTLAATVVGIGLGPTITGLLSDAYARFAGAQSLRWAMATVGLLYLWAGIHYFLCARTLNEDLRKVEAGDSLNRAHGPFQGSPVTSDTTDRGPT
jgi:predicted MFS family arabinose efflux permease